MATSALEECFILFATQSGRAKACARRTARIVRHQARVSLKNGAGSSFDELSILDQKLFDPSRNVFFIFFISTTGDGEHVDSIRKTWQRLLQSSLPNEFFRGMRFALFCLGDRAYGEQFCAAGRKFAVRLLQLGATMICDPGYGDDCTPNGGIFSDLDDWLDGKLLPCLTTLRERIDQKESSFNASLISPTEAVHRILAEDVSHDSEQMAMEEWQQDRYSSSYQSFFKHLCPVTAYSYDKNNVATTALSANDLSLTTTTSNGEPGRRMPPLIANILMNERITSDEWSQNTRHIELEIARALASPDGDSGGSDLPYKAGDVAVILPSNTATNVQHFLDALPDSIKFLEDKELCIVMGDGTLAETALLSSCDFWPTKCTLRGWLTHCADIHALPEREDLRALASYCSLDHERGLEQQGKLVSLSETSGAALYADYILREKRSWAEVLHDFDSLRAPGSKLTIEALFGLLQPMRPREFSIASSPLEVCEQKKYICGTSREYITRISLCVALIEGKTRLGRQYHGLCSDYLARLVPGTERVRMWIRPGSFAGLPLEMNRDDTDHGSRFDVPVLCIGAGTGIAPLRGLIRQREASRRCALSNQLSHDEQKLDMLERENLLIFGCRKQADDFYYQQEWVSLSESGRLGLLTAFSQDQQQKLYVQQVLRNADEEKSFIASHILAKNGAVYIAGGPKMARAIREVIVESLAQSLGSTQRAKQVILALQRKGRFNIEAWS